MNATPDPNQGFPNPERPIPTWRWLAIGFFFVAGLAGIHFSVIEYVKVTKLRVEEPYSFPLSFFGEKKEADDQPDLEGFFGAMVVFGNLAIGPGGFWFAAYNLFFLFLFLFLAVGASGARDKQETIRMAVAALFVIVGYFAIPYVFSFVLHVFSTSFSWAWNTPVENDLMRIGLRILAIFMAIVFLLPFWLFGLFILISGVFCNEVVVLLAEGLSFLPLFSPFLASYIAAVVVPMVLLAFLVFKE